MLCQDPNQGPGSPTKADVQAASHVQTVSHVQTASLPSNSPNQQKGKIKFKQLSVIPVILGLDLPGENVVCEGGNTLLARISYMLFMKLVTHS